MNVKDRMKSLLGEAAKLPADLPNISITFGGKEDGAIWHGGAPANEALVSSLSKLLDYGDDNDGRTPPKSTPAFKKALKALKAQWQQLLLTHLDDTITELERNILQHGANWKSDWWQGNNMGQLGKDDIPWWKRP